MPVSRRATHRLIRQLDKVGQEDAISDEAVERYERMYQHPLPRKTRAALQAITRIASGAVMEATAALAAVPQRSKQIKCLVLPEAFLVIKCCHC